MARVNVEQKALSDHRYAILGELIGGDKYTALGRMIYVWDACQEQCSYSLTEVELRAITGKTNFPEALVASSLGTRIKGGRIRIHGTKGRIEWLKSSRENGRKGGRPKKNPDGTRRLASGSAENNPPAPAPAPALKTKTKNTCAACAARAFDLLARFEATWAAYPRRRGKKEALRHYRASVKCSCDADRVDQALKNFLVTLRGQDPQFTPYGSKWFNNWRDDLELPAAADDDDYEPEFRV